MPQATAESIELLTKTEDLSDLLLSPRQPTTPAFDGQNQESWLRPRRRSRADAVVIAQQRSVVEVWGGRDWTAWLRLESQSSGSGGVAEDSRCVGLGHPRVIVARKLIIRDL